MKLKDELMQARVDMFESTQTIQKLERELHDAAAATDQLKLDIDLVKKEKDSIETRVADLQVENEKLQGNLIRQKEMTERVEVRFNVQSKELNTLQTRLVQATDPRIKQVNIEPLQKTIKELEGEVQILSLREHDFRDALRRKEQEL